MSPGNEFMSDEEWTTGRVVRPTNRHYASGIHDDAVAHAAGFRGGTIAGSAHLDTLVPLALERFGIDWFVSGSVSMAFTYATTDGEPTTAAIGKAAPGGQCPAKVETEDGTLVARGTVGANLATAPSHLRSSEPLHDTSSARILSALQEGDMIGPETDTIDAADSAHRSTSGLITEPLDWYSGESPWGSQIVPPSAVIDAANRVVSAQLLPILPPAVGMWSALEVQFVNGPLFAGQAYTVLGRIVAINHSPKTEVIWQDLSLSANGRTVATVRIQSRFMKSSSDLWNS